MGVYDQAARFAAQAAPEVVLARLLADQGVDWAFREWLDTRTIPLPRAPDRTADMVAAVSDSRAADRPWLVVMEFQAQADPDKLDVTLEEVAVLRSRVRFGEGRGSKYRVVAGMVYLLDCVQDDILDMTLPKGAGTYHAPLLWNVWKDDATKTLDAVALGNVPWGVLFWLPLMAGAGDEGVIRRWREVVTATVENRSMRGNMVGIALIFAELVGRVPEWRRCLEGFEMTESPIVNEWINQGRVQERVVQHREHLLLLLDERFPGVVPPEIRHFIERIDDPTLLRTWFAVGARSTFEEFLKAIKR